MTPYQALLRFCINRFGLGVQVVERMKNDFLTGEPPSPGVVAKNTEANAEKVIVDTGS